MKFSHGPSQPASLKNQANLDVQRADADSMQKYDPERNWFLMGFWMVLDVLSKIVQADWFCLEFPKGGFFWNFAKKKGRLSKSGVCHPKFNGLVGESLGPPPPQKKMLPRLTTSRGPLKSCLQKWWRSSQLLLSSDDG